MTLYLSGSRLVFYPCVSVIRETIFAGFPDLSGMSKNPTKASTDNRVYSVVFVGSMFKTP
jgi:hypothetical protein